MASPAMRIAVAFLSCLAAADQSVLPLPADRGGGAAGPELAGDPTGELGAALDLFQLQGKLLHVRPDRPEGLALEDIKSELARSAGGGRSNEAPARGNATGKESSTEEEPVLVPAEAKQADAAAESLAGESSDSDQYKDALNKQGTFLNMSRDFWLLLVIVGGGCLGAFVMVYCSVWLSTNMGLVGTEIPRDEKGHVQRPVFRPGFAQRVIFRADLNPGFAFRADMALRTAIVCAICALPYYVTSLHFINEHGFSLNYAVVIVVFTVYMDLGTTMSLAWYNFAGTLLPTVNCILSYGLFPHGSTEDGVYSLAWWYGMANFLLFISLLMAMSWPAGVRMFAVSWQAYFSMCFLNPIDTTHFSPGFQHVVLKGAAIGPLVGTVIGCLVAILALCPSPLGYTLSCLRLAQQGAIELAWEEGYQWRRMIKYYRSKEQSVLIDKITGEAHEIHARVNELEGYLGSNAWWECFDLGRPGRVKAHLTKLHSTISCMHDWLRGTLQAMKNEDFGDEHDALMEMVAEKLEVLSSSVSMLFFRAVRAAAAGGLTSSDEHERNSLRKDIETVKVAQRELAKEFAKGRRMVYGKDCLTADAIGEHFFVFSLSAYGQYATDFAEYILSDVPVEGGVGLMTALVQGTEDIFHFTGWGFASRSVLGFFSAFLLGFHGIPGVLARYNGTPAGTTAYLMATEGKGGSAIMKNIARFQGTGGGTIIGQLLFTTFVVCGAWGAVMGTGSMLLLEFLSMYLYFSSPSFGYVGVLFGAFGAQHLMLDCTSNGDDKKDVYGVIAQQMLAILCVSAADLLVGNVSSANIAVNHYYNLCEVFKKSINDIFCLDASAFKGAQGTTGALPEVVSERGALLAHFANAKAVGGEAPVEPRWYRTPWRDELWGLMMRNTFNMADKLAVIEYATLEGHEDGAARRAVCASVRMDRAGHEFVKRSKQLFLMGQKLLTHENEAIFQVPKKTMNSLLQQQRMSLSGGLPDLVKDICDRLPEQTPAKLESYEKLTQCDFCQVGVILLMLDGMMKNLACIEDELFAAPELLISNLEDD